MERSRSRGKPISKYSSEEIWSILEDSDGEDQLMEELEDDGEFHLTHTSETINDIRTFVNREFCEEPPYNASESVILEQPRMSSPEPALQPLFEIDEPVVLPSEEIETQMPVFPTVPRVEENFRPPPLRIDPSNLLPTAWRSEVKPLERERFTGYDQLKRQIQFFAADTNLWTIFSSILDEEVIDLMVSQTNIYAAQLQQLSTLKQHSRIKRWKDVTANEMLKFIGVYLLTGLIDFPTTECYWKKDRLYYHPLLHEISMSYDRFCIILRCWHFVDNRSEHTGRLFKIQPLIDKIIGNSRKIFTPGDTIAVDESMVGFRGKLNIRTYNPQKSDKYGMKIYKLCTDRGFTWSYKVYSGEDRAIEGLDKPGSVVINLAQELLNEGRLLVTDNYYTSVSLARYLKENKTDFCGTVRKNRRNLPPEVVNTTLKKGEIAAKQNDCMTVLKWKDQRDVLVLSTCHDHQMAMSTGFRPIMKPKIVLEYNRGKKGIDVADQLASYNSPVRKTCFWYKKIAADLMAVAVVNAILIYKDLNSANKLSLLAGHEIIIKHLLGIQDSQPSEGLSVRSSTSNSSIRSSDRQHALTKIPRRHGNKIFRKRCAGCYKLLTEQGYAAQEARKKAKKTDTECKTCNKALCLTCYNTFHKF